MKKIAIVGAGGFGREIACLIEKINESQGKPWEFIGFFDDGVAKGERGVLGNTDDLKSWNEPLDIVVAIGTPSIIKKIVAKIDNPNICFPNIIAPDFLTYEKELKIGKGNIICYFSSVSCDVEIGDFNVFNGRVNVGHDAKIGSFNVFMPYVAISGSTTFGTENFFGVGAIILQGVKVGNNVRVGAASVLIKKTKDNNLYMGNPATIVKF